MHAVILLGVVFSLPCRYQLIHLGFHNLSAINSSRTLYSLSRCCRYIIKPERVVKSITTYAHLPQSSVLNLLDNKHLLHLSESGTYRHVTDTHSIPGYHRVSNLTTQPAATTGDQELSHLVRPMFLDPYFMPLMSANVNETADAYVVTAQHDVVRDDGLLYAARLMNSTNVKVKLEHYKDGFHSFFHFSEGPLQLKSAQSALKNLINYLRHSVVQKHRDW